MPIRINLKELFPADPQQITVDKINFNFNKLLELGVGDQGERGFSGTQGPAGPIGIQGNDGVRGNAWFVDAAIDPNTLTFADLLVGDFYLDSQNFAVWQYGGTGWQFVFDLTEVIDNYLTASSTPFVRGLGIGSPNDDRFILFNKRGNTAFDSSQDTVLGAAPTGNNSNNDILFLNNFNEDFLDSVTGFDFGPALTPIGDQVSTMSRFNSLLSVYVDHQNFSAAQFGRYHLELGSLYLDGTEKKLTDVVDNLKIKFYTLPSINSFSDYYSIAEFSLDAPEEPTFVRKTNSLFHFRSSKWNDGGGVNTQFDLYIGSKFAIDETIGASGITKVDGILFNESAVLGNIGTAYRYGINGGNFPDETGYVTNAASGLNSSYFMLDVIGNSTAGIYLDSKTLQDGGNLIQLATTPPREITNSARVSSFTAPVSHLGHGGIVVRGDQVYTAVGEPAPTSLPGVFGYFNRFGIENPNSPISDYTSNSRFDGRTALPQASPGCPAPAALVTQQPIGPGIADLKIIGNYIYAVNSQSSWNTTATFGTTSTNSRRTYFQILETEGAGGVGLRRVSRLGQGSFLGSTDLIPGSGPADQDPRELDSAYRIELKGNHAIIGRNALPYATDSPTLDFNSPNYIGGFGVVDISDPLAPRIVHNFNDDRRGIDNSTVFGVFCVLDTCVVDDTLYAICLVQNEGSAPRPFQVLVKTYSLSGLSNPTPIITKKGLSETSLTSGQLSTYTNFARRAAICANRQYIYAGYGNAIKVYLNSNSISEGTIPNCAIRYKEVASFTLVFPSNYSSEREILDIEQVGNSLYVLAKAAAGGTLSTFVFKIDVSGGLENSRLTFSTNNPPTQIYRRQVSSGLGTRFVIVGKHIYVALVSETASDTNRPGLLALDFDGFYTGGAHIESLRSEKVEITKSLSVGDDITVHGDVEIGGTVFVNEEIAVTGNAEIGEDLNVGNDAAVGGELTVAGNVQLDSDLTVDGLTSLNGGTNINAPLSMIGALSSDTTIKSFAATTHAPGTLTETIAATTTDRFVYVWSNRYDVFTELTNGSWQMRIKVGGITVFEQKETVISFPVTSSTQTDRRQGLSVNAQFLIPASVQATIELKWENEGSPSNSFQIAGGAWEIYYRTQQLGL